MSNDSLVQPIEAWFGGGEPHCMYVMWCTRYDCVGAPALLVAEDERDCNQVLLRMLRDPDALSAHLTEVVMGYSAHYDIQRINAKLGLDEYAIEEDESALARFCDEVASSGDTFLYECVASWRDPDVEGGYTSIERIGREHFLGLEQALPRRLSSSSSREKAEWLAAALLWGEGADARMFSRGHSLKIFAHREGQDLTELILSDALWPSAQALLEYVYENRDHDEERTAEEYTALWEARAPGQSMRDLCASNMELFDAVCRGNYFFLKGDDIRSTSFAERFDLAVFE